MNNLIFGALTQEEQMAIADKWIPPAGLVLSEKNGAIIRDYIIAKAAQWNEHSFTQAALILRDKLEWEKKSDQRSAKARLTELGIRPSAHASQADKDADLDAKIKLARDFIENGPQGQRRRYKEQQARWDAEHVTLYFRNGRVDHAGSERQPSTYKDYKKDCFEKHLKTRLEDIQIRDFRTVTGQRLIAAISKANPHVGHKTLQRIKSFLSGTFKHAKREGLIDFENPMRDVSVPGRAVKFHGEVYTMHEIEQIAECVGAVDMKAFAVISVAAFAGLRMSELRGLRWCDFDGESLKICRSVWRTHVGPTKTASSEESVPVLPILKKVLDDHRVRVKGKDQDYIFAGDRRGTPLNLANLAKRVIKPALAKNELELLKWKGWHAFRRSLATNLYSCGVGPKVIQAILRHSDIGTTLAYYVSTPDAEAREALQKIDDWVSIV